MNNQLIPVLAGEIAGVPAQLVDAKLLHSFLEVGKHFRSWIIERINQYDFQENQDFISFAQNGAKPQGGRPTKEYHLSLGMAKELAMVEHNDKGKQARRYFMDCERQLREGNYLHPLLAPVSKPLTLAEFEQHRTALYDSLNALAENALRTVPVIISGADYLSLRDPAKPVTQPVPLKPYRPWTPEEDETAETMRAQGFNHTEIGRQLGRTNQAVKGRVDHLRYKKAIADKQGGV